MKKALLTVTIAFSLSISTSAFATNYSVQNDLSGVTAVRNAGYYGQAAGPYGGSVLFGDIDTGITPQWAGFTPSYNGLGVSNIDTADSAVCLGGVCPTGAFPTDGNGHGTFTASEMVGAVQSINMYSVAPAATLISVQVLNAQGSGYSNDVANGIIYAVNHGAQVLNLSLGPSGSASQQAAFYQSLASAINYAASKNAVIVFAGGNSAQAFSNGADITGFSDAALQRMFFMGSTNAGNGVNASTVRLSYFSNTPGNGYFISNTGKHYAYDNMWMMADGENIWGASNYHTAQYGYTYITQDTGTSMAAPQGAGAAGLLLSRWSFLASAGTIPQILETTALDLGTKGVDTKYGDGFLNVYAAMQPIGQLTVPVNGKMVPVTGSSIAVGGPLGDMSKVISGMTEAVVYDSFMRGFSANVANSIVSGNAQSSTHSASTTVSGQTGAGLRNFASLGNGAMLAFSGSPTETSLLDQSGPPLGLMSDPTRAQTGEWSYGLSSESGNYIGAGQGSNAVLSFNDARWGMQSAFANSDANASASLLALVPAANFASAGMALGGDARLAMSLVTSSSNAIVTPDGGGASAHGAALAYTVQPYTNMKVSLTSSFLNESNMLLGSTSGGYLALSPSASTMSVGIGSNLDLGKGYQIGFDAAYSSTSATGNAGSSLIDGTSRLGAAAFSLALAKNDVTGAGDTLGLSVDKPLRIYSGTASLSVPVGTDDNSNPIIQHVRVGLTPSGNETDLGLTYKRPVGEETSVGFNVSFRNDADNIAGAKDAAAMFNLKTSF